MVWVAFVLALVFGLATGALGVLGWRNEGRARAYYTAAGAVAFVQALTLGVIATYPSLQNGGYILVVALLGVVLVGVLAYFAQPGRSTN